MVLRAARGKSIQMVAYLWRSVLKRFFFSSRRRHTRSLRDWSSDVCSSDLSPCPADESRETAPSREDQLVEDLAPVRSEERRVGKECRTRWSPDHEKKKRESTC